MPDSLIEIKPTGKTTGEVVWEWHLWDHLIQDFDKTKPNFGNVGEHPGAGEHQLRGRRASLSDRRQGWKREHQSRRQPGGEQAAGASTRITTHMNGVAYNPDLDQISVSVWKFSEFWIIDHGTTTAQAASHTGGGMGKGGDLLYRWGNPRSYRSAGTKADRKLFNQHNAHWIPKGLPGAGHLLLFNNGPERPGGEHSSVDELVLPVDSHGRYARAQGKAFGPNEPVWSCCAAPKKSDFYSSFISGRAATGEWKYADLLRRQWDDL